MGVQIQLEGRCFRRDASAQSHEETLLPPSLLLEERASLLDEKTLFSECTVPVSVLRCACAEMWCSEVIKCTNPRAACISARCAASSGGSNDNLPPAAEFAKPSAIHVRDADGMRDGSPRSHELPLIHRFTIKIVLRCGARAG